MGAACDMRSVQSLLCLLTACMGRLCTYAWTAAVQDVYSVTGTPGSSRLYNAPVVHNTLQPVMCKCMAAVATGDRFAVR
jgi:hypothetical protein